MKYLQYEIWIGIKNGELLKHLIKNKFDTFLTFDKNLQHQQNFVKYTIAAFVLSANINSYIELTNLSTKVKEFLTNEKMPIGAIIIKILRFIKFLQNLTARHLASTMRYCPIEKQMLKGCGIEAEILFLLLPLSNKKRL